MRAFPYLKAPPIRSDMLVAVNVVGNAMKVISVNTGLPREITWRGRSITTGIFKEPVQGRIRLRTLNLDGDRQADLSVHGGPNKAVYCYQLAHYEYWKTALPDRALPLGMFGENFTVDGPLEDQIFLGDHYVVGSAEVVVAQPRMPCYKLGIRFQSDDMVKRFFDSRRSGFYLAVVREGEVGAGDEMTLVRSDPNRVPVSEIVRLYSAKHYTADDTASAQRVLQVQAVPESWKQYFRERIRESA
jgi:MOSC domain-containing protein YiiM